MLGFIYSYIFFFKTAGGTNVQINADMVDALGPTIRMMIQPKIVGLSLLLALIWWLGTITLTFVNLWQNDIAKIMAANKAVLIDPANEPRLVKIVTTLANESEIPLPQLYIIDTSAPNAFAYGSDPENAAITVTKGLVKILNDDELMAVMAGEITMIRNYGTRLMMFYYSVNEAVWNLGLGAVITIAGWFPNSDSGDGPTKRGDEKEGASSHISMVLLVIVSVILLPVVVMGGITNYLGSKLLNFNLSPAPEFDADAGAVELTNNKQGVIKALNRFRKIQREMGGYAPYSRMYFVPTIHEKGKTNQQVMRGEQPSLLARIKKVEKLVVK